MEPRYAALLSLAVTALPAFAQIGTLDPTFSGDGLVSTDIGSSTYDLGRAVALQPDGRIVVAGTSGYTKDLNFGVARYLADGTPDDSFNGTGDLYTPIGPVDDHATAVVVRPDGRILVGGYTFSPEGNRFVLVRYLTDGSLDTDFGTDGIVITDFPEGRTLEATCIALQPDGRILLAGGGAAGFAVVRYLEDGDIDTSFGEEGLATCAFTAGNDRANAMALQPNGRIVLAGYAAGTGADSIAVARLMGDGTIDGTFGNDGRAMASVPNLHTIGQGMAMGPDGEIVVAGYFIPAFTEDPAGVLVRFTAEGELDPAFNGTGIRQLADVGSGISMLNAVTVQPDGRPVACGWVSGATVDHLLVRLDTDGSYDTAFNGTGFTITDQSGNADRANAVLRQPDGRILLVGGTQSGAQDNNFTVARFQAEGGVGLTEFSSTAAMMSVAPQPVTSDAVLSYVVPEAGVFTIAIRDARGREVLQVLPPTGHAPGTYRRTLDGSASLASGVYVVTLRGPVTAETVRIIVP